MTADEFEFHMRVTSKDLTGYYYTRWDQAMPLTVRASNKAAALAKIAVVLGEPPSGYAWTAIIDRIESVAAPSSVVSRTTQ